MIQIFFDTNIWFDYCWTKHSKKRLKNRNFVHINRINSKKAKIILSDPLIYEISSLFKERFLAAFALEQGISPFEVRRLKREVKLPNNKRKKVDDIMFNTISPLPTVKNQLLVNWLGQKVLDKVFRLTSTHDIEFIDCLHLAAALEGNCDIFVTKDEQLINCFNNAAKTYRSLKVLTIMNPTNFLQNYKSSLYKKKK